MNISFALVFCGPLCCESGLISLLSEITPALAEYSAPVDILGNVHFYRRAQIRRAFMWRQLPSYWLLVSLSVFLGQIGKLGLWIYVQFLHFTDNKRKSQKDEVSHPWSELIGGIRIQRAVLSYHMKALIGRPTNSRVQRSNFTMKEQAETSWSGLRDLRKLDQGGTDASQPWFGCPEFLSPTPTTQEAGWNCTL